MSHRINSQCLSLYTCARGCVPHICWHRCLWRSSVSSSAPRWLCECISKGERVWEKESMCGPSVCVKVWEKWKETAGARRGGCRTADKGAYEAAPHDTLTHAHTAQRDMTLITAEIDLTLLKTVCGGGKKNETRTEWKHRSGNCRKKTWCFALVCKKVMERSQHLRHYCPELCPCYSSNWGESQKQQQFGYYTDRHVPTHACSILDFSFYCLRAPPHMLEAIWALQDSGY